MKCPYCGKVDNKVIDSRLSKDKYEIRRRRQCLECTRRFTTYEKTEDIQHNYFDTAAMLLLFFSRARDCSGYIHGAGNTS